MARARPRTRSTSRAGCTTRCRARAAGFCVYNDAALAIARLLELGAERVAYVDVDVHHGDGVQRVFWDDPRVLTISLHEHPRLLFPGTGLPDRDRRRRAGEGSAVNVALPAGHRRRRLAAGVPRGGAASWSPTSGRRCWSPSTAADTHFEDPLAHLAVSLDAQRAVQAALPLAGP